VDGNGVTGFKEASVVNVDGRWHVFVTTVSSAGYGLGYLSFSHWSDANSAPVHLLASSPIGGGYRAAPQVFYFAPQKLWYLIYESGNPSYSTNPDLNNPDGWSAPKNFYDGIPELIQKNLAGGYWLDGWVICDRTNCYLFSSDNRGHLFRSQTAKASFPKGMSQPVIAARDSGQGTTFAASHVYQVDGTGQYLLLSQAFGPDGNGYLRSWTATSIRGPWKSLADTPGKPFAGAADITFTGRAWTSHILEGELIRDGVDQTLAVNPCQLRLVVLGLDSRFKDNRTYQIGLLRQTNSTCH
jgi:endo-1,4-beta-xylanase